MLEVVAYSLPSVDCCGKSVFASLIWFFTSINWCCDNCFYSWIFTSNCYTGSKFFIQIFTFYWHSIRYSNADWLIWFSVHMEWKQSDRISSSRDRVGWNRIQCKACVGWQNGTMLQQMKPKWKVWCVSVSWRRMETQFFQEKKFCFFFSSNVPYFCLL